MKRIAAFLLLALCLLTPLTALAEQEENLLYNGDFSLSADTAALPAGWTLEAYDAQTAEAFSDLDEQEGDAVTIVCYAENDARVYQDVAVEPDTCYRFSAMMRADAVEGGAGGTLSIDNYALDGTYCYSDNVTGTSEWSEVAVYFVTGPEQTKVRAALRLGGYGLMSEGEVSFAQVRLAAEEPEDGIAAIDLMNENGTLKVDTGDAESKALNNRDVFLLILLCCCVLALAYAYVYRGTLRYEGATMPGEKPLAATLPLMLAAAFLLRVILSLIFYGHPTDINCFMAWGNAAYNGGFSTFYTSGMFADYPPGYMYICAGLSALSKLLHIDYGTTLMALLFKLPACIADLISAVFVYKIAKKNGISDAFSLTLAGLLLYCPVLMYVSGAWGQIDTLLTLGLVLCCWCLQDEKRILAGAIYGLTLILKPQALMLGPLLAVAYIASIPGKDWKKRLWQTVLGVLAAFAVLGLVSLPFKGTQDGLWLVDKFAGTATSYPYAAIEAFNLPALLGGNWRSVDARVLGLSYRVWGTAFIALSVIASCLAYLFSRKRGKGVLYLCGALMLMLIFTFGHYMHERYMIPVLLMLLMAYLYMKDRRILIAFGAVSGASLFNVLMAFYIITRQNARGSLYDAMTAIGSLATVAACLYLVYVCCRALFGKTPPRPLAPPVRVENTRAVLVPIRPPVEDKHWFTKRDTVYMVILTAVYAAVALLNLGTLKAPETYWRASEPGESMRVEFGREVEISSYMVYGNIDTGGTLLLSAGDTEETYAQTYDQMFRWDKKSVEMTTDHVVLTLYAGTLRLNEMAFFDAEGKLLPVTVAAPAGTQANLFDEQDTVPDEPSYFNGMYFDELYHGRTAYEHLHNLSPYENSHPPLGKIFIMIGVAIFGMCPFGWRVMGALFGIGMLPIFYCFGKRLFKRSDYALLAAGLFAFDFMHFTQTRIATVDVFAVFFIILMFYFMYRFMSADFFGDPKACLKHLALSGLFFGLGAASKWICIYAGAGLAVLLFGTLTARYLDYRRAMQGGTAAERAYVEAFMARCVSTLLWCLLLFVAIPFVIYFLSYLPYFIYETGQKESYGLIDMFRTFIHYQEFMYNYHSGLEATHPYQSSWYSWPFTLRPMWYYFTSGEGYISTMSASGNPAVWWVCTLGSIGLFIAAVCRRVRRESGLWVLLVGVLANFLPWVLVSRCTFIYHFFATVPFIILAGVYLLMETESAYPRLKPAKWVWLVLAIALFALLYPGLSGYPISPQWGAFLHKLPGGELMYGA